MNSHFMHIACKEAKKGLENVGEGPFGACVVKKGEIISLGHNQVVKDHDPTAHAEIVAIREACRKLGTFELKECELFSTCEPCPMCFGAIYWCRLKKLYYGTNRHEAAEIGFDDEFIYEELAKQKKDRRLITTSDVSREECVELFTIWKNKPDKIRY
jgi:guanine deaminase